MAILSREDGTKFLDFRCLVANFWTYKPITKRFHVVCNNVESRTSLTSTPSKRACRRENATEISSRSWKEKEGQFPIVDYGIKRFGQTLSCVVYHEFSLSSAAWRTNRPSFPRDQVNDVERRGDLFSRVLPLLRYVTRLNRKLYPPARVFQRRGETGHLFPRAFCRRGSWFMTATIGFVDSFDRGFIVNELLPVVLFHRCCCGDRIARTCFEKRKGSGPLFFVSSWHTSAFVFARNARRKRYRTKHNVLRNRWRNDWTFVPPSKKNVRFTSQYLYEHNSRIETG